MAKSFYKYIGEAWRKPGETYVHELRWHRLQDWRKEPTVNRVERPTRLDRARSLGYKAKQGIIVARTRVRRGGLRKSHISKGRRSQALGVNKITMGKSIQRIAEERTARRFPNMIPLNSYWVGEDGKHKWFEVILIDPSHPAIKSDAQLSWVTGKQRGRAHRGKTSAGQKGRGIRHRGKGTEKTRPSIRANSGRGK